VLYLTAMISLPTYHKGRAEGLFRRYVQGPYMYRLYKKKLVIILCANIKGLHAENSSIKRKKVNKIQNRRVAKLMGVHYVCELRVLQFYRFLKSAAVTGGRVTGVANFTSLAVHISLYAVGAKNA
jgi:hypothetical protein